MTKAAKPGWGRKGEGFVESVEREKGKLVISNRDCG